MTAGAPWDGEVDWDAVYKRLRFGRGRFRDREIARMTMAELDSCLDDNLEDDRPAGSLDISGLGAKERNRAWWRKATAQDRIDYYRRKYGY